jgi:hypothetical protein
MSFAEPVRRWRVPLIGKAPSDVPDEWVAALARVGRLESARQLSCDSNTKVGRCSQVARVRCGPPTVTLGMRSLLRCTSPNRCDFCGFVIAFLPAEVGRGDECGVEQACWRVKEPNHPCELFGHNDVGLGGGQYLIHVLVGDAHRQRSGPSSSGRLRSAPAATWDPRQRDRRACSRSCRMVWHWAARYLRHRRTLFIAAHAIPGSGESTSE